jgi:hypothetical protein
MSHPIQDALGDRVQVSRMNDIFRAVAPDLGTVSNYAFVSTMCVGDVREADIYFEMDSIECRCMWKAKTFTVGGT